MSQKYEKLKTLLKELFQLDQPDLDFGLYRIMHAKSAEVTQFLDRDLLPQVQAAFGQYKSADKAELEKELAKVIAGIEAAGMDSAQSPKVADLRARLANDAVDIGALESEVYDHLFGFFRRYYSEGDFLSLRRYKEGVYAIPYEGEEVTLHWANKDQYYIKTSEYLRDYAFRLRPEDDKKPMRVHFRLADAAEGEHGNVKAAEGKDRVFILSPPGKSGRDFIAEEDGEHGKELVIRFEYRPATLADWPENARAGKSKPPAQKDLSALAAKRVLAMTDALLAAWIAELGKPHVTTSGEKADYMRLEAHLRRYTARNTFDYFIHKDLGTFLRRELDFYIKNEVMHLDDVENETAPRVEQYLSKIKVMRKIAGKIITFLAQLEDFQKKLWLKKKFVVETQWCITLGCIPEAFYVEIAANEAQREEWVKLFAIDEIEGELMKPGYSKKLKPEFLKEHPTLVVDARHFDADFVARLLEAIGEVDEQTDGVLYHSENFQALSIVQAKYLERIKCVYIDPPYNTGSDGFVYKDSYQHSSWATMLEGRIAAAASLLSEGGLFLCSCDRHEHHRLRLIAESIFGEAAFVESFMWIRAQNPSNLSGRTRQMAESVLCFQRGVDTTPFKGELLEDQDSQPLYNAGNPIGRLHFPIDSVQFGFDRADLDPGEYGKGPITLEERLRVRSSRNETPFVLTGPFRWRQDTLDRELAAGTSFRVATEKALQPRFKRVVASNFKTPDNILLNKALGVSSNEEARDELIALFGALPFDYPKPISLVSYLVRLRTMPEDVVLDHFAGSGTTGHAVINLNREDGGTRKFILVEMGDYFDTVLLPRIKKVTFTPEWKDGKPKRLATPEEAERSPRIVKVVRLESYEDALNNLETRRTGTQQLLLGAAEAQGADGLKEQYILRYLLDVETRGSQSLLNVQAFTDPTAYKLKVKRPGSDESREVNVDLLETFNWLIGLTVKHIAAPQSFSAAFERDSEKRLRLSSKSGGRLKQDAAGPYWFRTVTGTTPDGRKALIIWRKLTGEPEQDNLVLDEWFTKQGYSAKDSEFDLIYVNGGNNLENLKTPDDLWKVRLIEEDFHRLMFETEGA